MPYPYNDCRNLLPPDICEIDIRIAAVTVFRRAKDPTGPEYRMIAAIWYEAERIRQHKQSLIDAGVEADYPSWFPESSDG